MSHPLIKKMHQQAQSLLRSDMSLIVAIAISFVWAVHELTAHHGLDVVNSISLISFLLVFFIERAHGKEMKAIHLKLDELIAAQSGASNRLIRVEDAPEEVLNLAHDALQELVSHVHPHESVSVEHTGCFTDPEKKHDAA